MSPPSSCIKSNHSNTLKLHNCWSPTLCDFPFLFCSAGHSSPKTLFLARGLEWSLVVVQQNSEAGEEKGVTGRRKVQDPPAFLGSKYFPDYTCAEQSWTWQPESFSMNPGIARLPIMGLEMSICQLYANYGISCLSKDSSKLLKQNFASLLSVNYLKRGVANVWLSNLLDPVPHP